MAYVDTLWDYELKEEVFRVNGEKGYLHKTQVLIRQLTPETSYDDLLAYCLMKFEVDVKQDIGNSYIVMYDNGKAIPFTINNVEYTQYPWTDNTTKKTVYLKLGYGVEHNIICKYMGNTHGLSSKSIAIPVFVDVPNDFYSALIINTQEYQYNSSTVNIPLRFRTGAEHFPNTNTKKIKVFEHDDDIPIAEVTLTPAVNSNYVDGTLTLNDVTNGLHNYYILFEGDDDNVYCELRHRISVGYDVSYVEYPHSTVYCNSNRYDNWNVIKVRVKDWYGNPIVGGAVTATGVHTLTENTNSEGIATFIESDVNNFLPTYNNSSADSSLTIPCLHIISLENSISDDYLIKNGATAVATKIKEYEWEHGTGRFINIPVYVSDSNNNYTAYLDDAGACSLNYVNTNETDVTLTSMIGDITVQNTFEVVWQYWNVVKNIDLNRKYTMMKGEGIDTSIGFKIKSNNDRWAIIGFGEGTTGFGQYEITFNNVQELKNVRLQCGGWHRGEDGYISWSFPSQEHPNNPDFIPKTYLGKRYPFRLRRWKDSENYWHVGVWHGSVNVFSTKVTRSANGEPAIAFIFDKNTDSAVIDDIKIKRIN